MLHAIRGLWSYPKRNEPEEDIRTAKMRRETWHTDAAEDCSEDVECLKWQAYLALRGLTDIAVRWDVQPEGALEGRLPNLRVPMKEVEPKIQDDGEGDLLPAHMIKEWVDNKVGELAQLEGFVDEAARDESRAWIKLLEGDIHAALVRS